MLADNLEGKLPLRMRSAGLADVVEEDRVPTALGPLVFWRGRRVATPMPPVVTAGRG